MHEWSRLIKISSRVYMIYEEHIFRLCGVCHHVFELNLDAQAANGNKDAAQWLTLSPLKDWMQHFVGFSCWTLSSDLFDFICIYRLFRGILLLVALMSPPDHSTVFIWPAREAASPHHQDSFEVLEASTRARAFASDDVWCQKRPLYCKCFGRQCRVFFVSFSLFLTRQATKKPWYRPSFAQGLDSFARVPSWIINDPELAWMILEELFLKTLSNCSLRMVLKHCLSQSFHSRLILILSFYHILS